MNQTNSEQYGEAFRNGGKALNNYLNQPANRAIAFGLEQNLGWPEGTIKTNGDLIIASRTWSEMNSGKGGIKMGRLGRLPKIPRSRPVISKANAPHVKASSNSANQTYSRVMSEGELAATKRSNLLRGGREGKNFFTTPDKVSKDSKRNQQRLGLDGETREYKMDFEITDKDIKVAGPGRAKAGESGTSGGGTEFSTDKATPIVIKKVSKLKNKGR